RCVTYAVLYTLSLHDALPISRRVVHGARSPRRVEVDELLAREVGPVHTAARGERVLGRAHEHEGLAPEDGLRERPEVVRGRDERDVEVALAHAREEVVRAGLGELDLDLGVATVEALEQGGDVEDPEALLGPDAQR